MSILIVLCLLSSGCRNPFDRTRDASGAGPTGTFSGNANFVIFNNELVSGGGAFLYPGGENQSLSFSDTSNPIGYRSIRYSWTGGLVSAPGCTPNPTSLFAGFDLMHTAVFSDYASTPGRDLHQGNYVKVTFFARGSLSSHTVLKIEAATPSSPAGCSTPPIVPCLWLSDSNSIDIDDGANDQKCGHLPMTGSWQAYTVPIPSGWLAGTQVKDFFKATFVFNQPFGVPAGQGGTVYFDQIQYEP